MKIRVRRALLSDVETIVRINVESWKKNYRGIIHDSYLDHIDVQERILLAQQRIQNRNCYFWVAYLDDSTKRVVGFCFAGRCRERNSDADAEIQGLYADVAFQGLGVGKALFDAAMKQLKQAGYQKVLISVLKDNLQARRFYERQGGTLGPEDKYVLQGFTYVTSSYLWELNHRTGGKR